MKSKTFTCWRVTEIVLVLSLYGSSYGVQANDCRNATPDIQQNDENVTSTLTYYPGDGTLNLTCTFNNVTSSCLMVWEVNGTTYRLDELVDGKLVNHAIQDNALVIDQPINNTVYKCFNLESNLSTSVIIYLAGVPDQVTGLEVVYDTVVLIGTNSSFTLSWEVPFDNNYPISNYTIICSDNVTCPADTTVDSNTTSFNITNVTSGSNYTFSVQATNAIGSGSPTVMSIVGPSVPEKVVGITLRCTAVDDNNRCEVQWQPIVVGGGTLEQPVDYHVYYMEAMMNFNATTTSLIFYANVISNEMYMDNVTVMVTAENRFEKGPFSAPATDVVVASAIVSATATLSTQNMYSDLHNAMVHCNVNGDSIAQRCMVMAVPPDSTVIQGNSSIMHGAAVMILKGLKCDTVYTIKAAGTFDNGTLIGPFSTLTTIASGPCSAVVLQKGSSDDTRNIIASIGGATVVGVIVIIITSIFSCCCMAKIQAKYSLKAVVCEDGSVGIVNSQCEGNSAEQNKYATVKIRYSDTKKRDSQSGYSMTQMVQRKISESSEYKELETNNIA